MAVSGILGRLGGIVGRSGVLSRVGGALSRVGSRAGGFISRLTGTQLFGAGAGTGAAVGGSQLLGNIGETVEDSGLPGLGVVAAVVLGIFFLLQD